MKLSMTIHKLSIQSAQNNLDPDCFVKVLTHKDGSIVGWCSVKTIPELIFNQDPDDFYILLLDDENLRDFSLIQTSKSTHYIDSLKQKLIQLFRNF